MGGRTRAEELTDGTRLTRRGRVSEHGGAEDGRPGLSTRSGRMEREMAYYGKWWLNIDAHACRQANQIH